MISAGVSSTGALQACYYNGLKETIIVNEKMSDRYKVIGQNFDKKLGAPSQRRPMQKPERFFNTVLSICSSRPKVNPLKKFNN